MILEQDNAFYQAALRMGVGCLAQLDRDGVIQHFDNYLDAISPAEAKTFVGQRWNQVFAPVNGQECVFDNASPGKGSSGAPQKVLARYDDRLFMDWKFLTLEPPDSKKVEPGNCQGTQAVIGVGIDVTKYVELKQQLTHADRLATVGQLAAGIAHEINGPLNNILGYAQLSAKQEDLPEQVYQDLDNIIRLSLHAREVVKKVMLFSRQVPPKHDRVDLGKVVQDGLHFTEPLCRRKNVRVDCIQDEELPGIEGDHAQLRQVVVNLLVNAAQSMSGEAGRIEISLGKTPDRNLVMSIKDNGSGMSESTLKQCFMPFFTTKDVNEGTGLGLSVVHGIIESHRGTITAQSTPGVGSEFTVTFPAYSINGKIEGSADAK